jgi:OmpA-OmpF porin, OOP family
MKKLYFIIVVIFSCCTAALGQNLVPNPGFENTSQCPYSLGQVNFAAPWFQPTTLGTSDYFNSCTASTFIDVPQNYFGYQNARNGNAYAGFFTYYYGDTPYNYREYIEVPLSSALVVGNTYYVNFYVSQADSANYATDDIGVFFSNSSVTSNNYNPLPYIPQVSNPSGNIIVDKWNWIMISGFYTAAGGEAFLTIGNFKGDSATDTLYVGGGDFSYPDYKSSYYFIDDVCVSAEAEICLTSIGIEKVQVKKSVNPFPNPFQDKLNFDVKGSEVIELNMYDITLRKVLQTKFTNLISLDAEQLGQGIYIYELRNKNGVFENGKVVKE